MDWGSTSWCLMGDEPTIDRTKYDCKVIATSVAKTIDLLDGSYAGR